MTESLERFIEMRQELYRHAQPKPATARCKYCGKSYPVGEFNLVPVTDMRKVTTAQYIDVLSFSKDKEHNIVEMLSCFLVPKGMDYNEGYDILDVHNAIKEEMSVAEVLALLAFFFKSWFASIRDTLSCSVREAMKIEDKETKKTMLKKIRSLLDSKTVGDGSPM